MRKAKIGELKNNLSRYLRYVKAGDTVLVLERDQPVAQIVPLSPRRSRTMTDDERLDLLERQGLIRRGTGGFGEWLRRRKRLPRLKGSVLQALLDERRSGW